MSETFVIQDDNGSRKEFDSRAEAIEQKEDLEALGADVELLEPNGSGNTKGEKETQEADAQADIVDAEHDLPDSPPVDTDPLTWIPDEFQDRIDGTVAINRKGFEVLAHHYNISCQTDMVDFTDERVIHKAKAHTENGTVYTAYGEAHSSEDTETQLVRLSDTRAFKRAISRATGIGMVAVEELKNSLR